MRSKRKGQTVNTEGERQQRVEDEERNKQKQCNAEGSETRRDERDGAGYERISHCNIEPDS